MTDKSFVEKLIDKTMGYNITVRPMMGEYVVYYKEKVIGGLYDNRFLVKVTDGSKEILKNATLELPYQGAKMMLKVDMDKANLMELFEALYNDLPAPKTKKRSKK